MDTVANVTSPTQAPTFAPITDEFGWIVGVVVIGITVVILGYTFHKALCRPEDEGASGSRLRGRPMPQQQLRQQRQQRLGGGSRAAPRPSSVNVNYRRGSERVNIMLDIMNMNRPSSPGRPSQIGALSGNRPDLLRHSSSQQRRKMMRRASDASDATLTAAEEAQRRSKAARSKRASSSQHRRSSRRRSALKRKQASAQRRRHSTSSRPTSQRKGSGGLRHCASDSALKRHVKGLRPCRTDDTLDSLATSIAMFETQKQHPNAAGSAATHQSHAAAFEESLKQQPAYAGRRRSALGIGARALPRAAAATTTDAPNNNKGKGRRFSMPSDLSVARAVVAASNAVHDDTADARRSRLSNKRKKQSTQRLLNLLQHAGAAGEAAAAGHRKKKGHHHRPRHHPRKHRHHHHHHHHHHNHTHARPEGDSDDVDDDKLLDAVDDAAEKFKRGLKKRARSTTALKGRKKG